MNDLAIMYHYVRQPNWKGIVPLSPENFISQLEWVAKHYDIVSPDDLSRPIRAKPRCTLTFDDATKDQFEVAFDILNRKGIPAYFTVMAGPLVKKEIPVMHLVHTVLSFFSDEEIWNDLKTEFNGSDIFTKSSKIYSYEKNELRRNNKYVLNFEMSEKQSRKFLERKVMDVFPSFGQFIDSFYITVEEFKKMKAAGMTIGVHAFRHHAFHGNGRAFFDSEIAPCRRFIQENLGFEPKWYTPAFGGGPDAKEMLIELEPVLRLEGFVGAFTTTPGFNDGLSKFWLNRFDCIHVPPLGNY